MSRNFEDFQHWFEVNNMSVISRASQSQVIHGVQRFAAGDADLEFDLREELYGPGGYLC
jgi:hypothetical protein